MTMGVIGYHFQGNEIVGDVMGGGDYNLHGDDVDGDYDVVGRGRRTRKLAIPSRPQWRNQLAPGVIQPDEGLVPLALAGQAGSPAGFFSATVPTITFQVQLQKPFRAGRLLASTVRTGVSAVGRILACCMSEPICSKLRSPAGTSS